VKACRPQSQAGPIDRLITVQGFAANHEQGRVNRVFDQRSSLLSDDDNIARSGGFLKKYFVNIWLRHPVRLLAKCRSNFQLA
jgi:hypothetical protein